ncbi:tRNA (adenine(22)-N(1))-methyltransferase TrmK [Ammoniphilus sp. CFH 90114]|uniref:tRNA (adenine(22)-N(1))-methyltransferase n=1 Tax=Ammoniphilus sp. CFH 90114 TaxID=2493665 RepID=UPI0010100463|nr:tRNA (adenine(22)-N(1))-methyltransferase TrmK [Ammoniphilus sp. CFH 90114]RXT15500.1 tRNA (adenine-N(1))-methyltransferase [Ammoniphilus sp. CFH 90114]
MLTVSKRLHTIASYVQPNSKVADIGSDHAILPVYLVQTGKAQSAIAGEVNKGPWESAKRQVEAAGLADRIAVRLGDGLSVLKDGEVNTVCIAGMGGTLIRHILEEGIKNLSSVQHLVLQPNVAEYQVREWLYRNGWQLTGESILEEDGVIYEIISAIKGDPDAPYQSNRWLREEWFELGPILWEERSPILLDKWEAEKKKSERVLQGLDKARSEEAESKRIEIEKRLTWIEEVLECLRTDKP